ncbi:MAG: dual specificity protein phosphatase family protein, partial [Anaerolineae bacterium]|nr:dual specificity protein phosphatase family protein [Anaerolineae bacterium]
MTKLLKLAWKPFRIVIHRLRNHGPRATWMWAWGRGVTRLTGAVVLSHCQITPTLYVGPQHGTRGKRQLERAGITGDVNLRIEYDDAAHGLALEHYCHLPTIDETPPTLEHLHAGAAFIQRVIADGGKVYIHCAGGVGRAPTMAAAYLLTQGYTLDAAHDLIRQGRPYVDVL